MSEYEERKKLADEIIALKHQISDIKSQMAAGQQSYAQTVVSADYSHQHMPSAIKSGTTAADWVFTGSVTIPSATVTAHEADIDHDALTNFLANEHIDWTNCASNFLTSGTATFNGVVQVGAVKVNLANGTTYYLDLDGDAVLKDLTASKVTASDRYQYNATDGQNQSVLRSDKQSLDANHIRYELSHRSDDTSFLLFGYDGTTYKHFLECDYPNGLLKSSMDLDMAGFIDAAAGFKDNGTAGVDGTFVDANAKTVTVSGGIITNLDT